MLPTVAKKRQPAMLLGKRANHNLILANKRGGKGTKRPPKQKNRTVVAVRDKTRDIRPFLMVRTNEGDRRCVVVVCDERAFRQCVQAEFFAYPTTFEYPFGYANVFTPIFLSARSCIARTAKFAYPKMHTPSRQLFLRQKNNNRTHPP